jgi:hypothetical protein
MPITFSLNAGGKQFVNLWIVAGGHSKVAEEVPSGVVMAFSLP